MGDLLRRIWGDPEIRLFVLADIAFGVIAGIAWAVSNDAWKAVLVGGLAFYIAVVHRWSGAIQDLVIFDRDDR